MVVLSVHVNTCSKVTVRACEISFFRQASGRFACNSKTRSKNSIQPALEAAYQHLRDNTLIWSAGLIEPPLYTSVRELSFNVENVPIFNTPRSSFCAPIKLVPLSDQIMAGVPLRDTNRSTPITQELVSMVVTILTWTARVVRQMNRKPHLFSVVRRTVT